MIPEFEDEDELVDAMWDENLAGTPKWVGRRLSDIREEFWQQTMGDDLQDELEYLAEEGFGVPQNISDVSFLHHKHPTDDELREKFATQAEEGSIFLHLVSARIDGEAKFTLVGFHADIPGGEWEVCGMFDKESELTADVLKNWHVEVCDS